MQMKFAGDFDMPCGVEGVCRATAPRFEHRYRYRRCSAGGVSAVYFRRVQQHGAEIYFSYSFPCFGTEAHSGFVDLRPVSRAKY